MMKSSKRVVGEYHSFGSSACPACVDGFPIPCEVEGIGDEIMMETGELLSVRRRLSNESDYEGQVLADGFLKLDVTLVKEGNFYTVRLCAIDELTNRLLDLNKIQLCWRHYE